MIVVVILSQERNLIPFPSVFIWTVYLKFFSIKSMQSVNFDLYFKQVSKKKQFNLKMKEVIRDLFLVLENKNEDKDKTSHLSYLKTVDEELQRLFCKKVRKLRVSGYSQCPNHLSAALFHIEAILGNTCSFGNIPLLLDTTQSAPKLSSHTIALRCNKELMFNRLIP